MKKSKNKILVTGGAGYIGSHVVNELLKNGFEVDVVDIFLESKENIIKNKLVKYHNIDIRNKNKLNIFFKKSKPDIVMHFAALSKVPESTKKVYEYYETNIIGGINILECMRENKVNKIVFSSSASVYGEPKKKTIDESHPKNPTSPYGNTKLIFEMILGDYYEAYGISSISLRYFCAAGADFLSGLGEYHNPETHVIPSIIETILGRRKEFFVYGDNYKTKDGTGVRDYIHVLDLSNAHICAMKKIFEKENIYENYNLGINKGFSVMELIKTTEKISGKKLDFKIKERRPGDPSKLIAISKKAQKNLNWKPKFTKIEDIVLSTFNSLKNK